jgi:hypothetical protein
MINEPLAGYGGLTPEAVREIIERAHRERQRALRQFFARLFRRRGATPVRATQASIAACGTTH